MSQVEITAEREAGAGWSFDAHVIDDEGALSQITLRLSWADYNLWSTDGSAVPTAVAEAALRFIVACQGWDSSRTSLDASIARRLSPNADTAIPTMIAR